MNQTQESHQAVQVRKQKELPLERLGWTPPCCLEAFPPWGQRHSPPRPASHCSQQPLGRGLAFWHQLQTVGTFRFGLCVKLCGPFLPPQNHSVPMAFLRSLLDTWQDGRLNKILPVKRAEAVKTMIIILQQLLSDALHLGDWCLRILLISGKKKTRI